MKTNLENILKQHPNKSILHLKKHLLDSKKQGIVFFKENIFELLPETQFELFSCVAPSKKTSLFAFPIPFEDYLLLQNKKQISEHFQEFFEDYHKTSYINQNYELFIGKKFVWCYL